MTQTPVDHELPIDRDALKKATLPFGSSRLLPQECYTSNAVLEWETRHFFEGGWVCVGTTQNLKEPGDQQAVKVGKDGLLLVRDEKGKLNGFFNVCRHRAGELLEAGQCAKARSIRCFYHAWTYGLDGSLRFGGEGEAFDRTKEGLVPARVEEWGNWVFANVSGGAPPLKEWLGDLDEVAKGYECSRLRVGLEHSYEIAANWKLVVENYSECYHCSQIHPEFCRLSPPESGENTRNSGAFIGGTMEMIPEADTMSIDGKIHGVPFRALPPELRRKVLYYAVFPNLLLSFHPDYVMTHRAIALSPGRTWIECQWLFPPESFETPGFSPHYAADIWDITNKQDWHAVESVQRGIASHGYLPGTLSSSEDAVYQFVSRVARGYLEGSFEPIATPSLV